MPLTINKPHCSKCGGQRGFCSCPNHNAQTEEDASMPFDKPELLNKDTYASLDAARSASRKAAQATLSGMPDEDASSREPAHYDLARHALAGLRRVHQGDMAGAARSHDKAAKILDAFELQALENGGNGKFEARAADAHREAARMCSMATNQILDGAIPTIDQQAYFTANAAPGLLKELGKLGVNADDHPDSSWSDAAPGPGMADIEDEEDRRYSEDGYGNPVRTLDPVSALKEWLGMSFSDQENARKMGVESFPPGDHSYDFSNVAPAQNAYYSQERPARSGWEGLANAHWGPAVNDARAPIPTPSFTEMLVQNASPGLLKALGKGGLVANVPPPAESITANYNAPLTINGSFAPDSPIPTQTINWVATASPGLMRALGKL
jgi:hypothetical protein